MAKRGSRRSAARSNTRRKQSEAPPKRSAFSRFFRGLITWGLVLAFLGTIALGVAVAVAANSLPSYHEMKEAAHANTVIVRARDGSELVELGPSYGVWVSSNEIPQVMKDAMVAVEDRRFYSHFGVDPIGLSRAVYLRATGQKRLQATSTITQQLARNIFLNSNRTVERKMREAVLAMALEWKFSKEQILELYLNKVYFGGGAYGVDSASRKFFSHPATELTTAEAAIIAGLVKAPSNYSPTADIDAAVGRANVVLRLMREQGRISALEEDVDVSAVKLSKEKSQNSARYFTDWALGQLEVLLNEPTFQPIEVWTTLDPGMQRAATSAIRTNAPAGAQGALVSLDRDGAVLAMVGGRDYVSSNYNRATEAMRQPGSAWKLFVYLAALEAGYTPDDRVVDKPVTIDGWSPRNSGGRYAGPIDVRTAFAYSKNTVAAQLGNEVGFSSVAAMARRFGITTPINTMPSMVLGSSEVRVIDMTRAFAAVAAQGQAVEPYGIVKVTTADGEVLYQHKPRKAPTLVPDYVAAEMIDLLQTTVSTGTGRAAHLGRPTAGKTGTTSSNKDGWFVGFSSGVTTGVWMGRDDAKPVKGLQGGAAPARAFASYMRVAVKNRPVEQFDTQVELPAWQLEPEDPIEFGGSNEYYYIDEEGNLIAPRVPEFPGESPFPLEGEADPALRNRPEDDSGQAASDEFIERAIRGPMPRRQAPSPPAPGNGGNGQAEPSGRRPPPPVQISRPPATPPPG